jgi:hypothetical protein
MLCLLDKNPSNELCKEMNVPLSVNSRMMKYKTNVSHLEIQSLIAMEKMCEQYIERYSDHVDYNIIMQLLIFRDDVLERLTRLRRQEKLKNYYKIYK